MVTLNNGSINEMVVLLPLAKKGSFTEKKFNQF